MLAVADHDAVASHESFAFEQTGDQHGFVVERTDEIDAIDACKMRGEPEMRDDALRIELWLRRAQIQRRARCGKSPERLGHPWIDDVFLPADLCIALAVTGERTFDLCRIIRREESRERCPQRRADAATQRGHPGVGDANQRERVADRSSNSLVVVGDRSIEIEEQRARKSLLTL